MARCAWQPLHAYLVAAFVLKRRSFSRDDIHEMRKAYRLIFAAEGTMVERLEDVAEDFGNNEAVMDILQFIRANTSRAICQPAMDDAA